MPKYSLEFILCVRDISTETLKSAIVEFGEDLDIAECSADDTKDSNFLIHIRSEDPTIVFDACAQFGRIKSVKVNEEKAGEIQNPNTTNTTGE